ncbi:MAG: WbuC family cupin fold metalloprotein [Candidatus Aminicenantaceae bacterium]
MDSRELGIDLREVTEEVLFTRDPITKVDRKVIEFLKAKAFENRRKRIRLCTHVSVNDSVHEMLIVHSKGSYVRPHKHLKKSESFHVIEGKLKVIIFDESGNIIEVISMGDYSSGDAFFYRIQESRFHTVIPISGFVVFHETTKGPFLRKDTLFAQWAPEEDDNDAQKIYMNNLTIQLGLDL